MRRLSLEKIIIATRGTPSFPVKDTYISGISLDSRTTRRGELFVAIRGEHADGHDFVASALQRGATGAVVSRPLQKAWPLVWVKNTTHALGDIARLYRSQFDPRVIGITGSNGKTTTKCILAHILASRYTVVSSPASYNNFIGVPLTMFSITPKTDIVIQEMETNVLGGIQRLCDIAKPSAGIVTNIGLTHLESLKNVHNVFREKSELLSCLPAKGVAILNADDQYFSRLKAATRARVEPFSIKRKARFQAKDILCGKKLYFSLYGVRFTLNTPFFKNVYNALAAVTLAHAIYGVSLKQAKVLLQNFVFPPLRSQVIKKKGAFIIQDCYNANPQSVEDALMTLVAAPGKRKIAMLGDMRELGAQSALLHRKLGVLCARLKIDELICVGHRARSFGAGAASRGMKRRSIKCCQDTASAAAVLKNILRVGDVVLLKGSRAMGLEAITNAL